MICRSGGGLIDQCVRQVVFEAFDRPENPCVKRRMLSLLKLPQGGSQKAMFERWVAIDIQTRPFALVG
jgi:hypothetical protein